MKLAAVAFLAAITAFTPTVHAQRTNGGGRGGSGASIIFKQAPTTSPPQVATTIYTTPAGSGQVYRICSQLIVTAAGTAGSVSLQATYTSQSHTFSGTNYTQIGPASYNSAVAVTTQWNQGSGCFTFTADGGTNIQAWLGLGGVTGSPTYLYSVTLERLQ